MKSFKLIFRRAGLPVFLALSALQSWAGTWTVFGPKAYVRPTGNPVAVTDTFSIRNPNTTYTLHLQNGGLQDDVTDYVSSTVITVNGVTVVAPNDLNQNTATLDRALQLQTGSNTITVEVRGKPGGQLAVSILGTDADLPTIQATVNPPANAASWNNTSVTVSFLCSDATSGIASCTSSVTVTQEGANQVVTGTAIDLAGNVATQSVTLNIDKTAPAVQPVLTPAPTSSGWNNTNVTVSFNCSDALSGVTACSPARTFTQEGAGQSASGTATDKAGNSSNATATVNIDLTPPLISASVSPAPGANGIINATSAVVTFTCSDALSGVLTCPSPSTATATGLQTIRGTAIDKAGNTANASIQFTLQPFPPLHITATASPTANAAGWNNTPVTVTFQCSGGAPPVVCPGPQTINSDGAGQIVTGTATDSVGSAAQASVTINLDQAPPLVSITSPAAGSLSPSASVLVSGTASDSVSGVATVSCNGTAATFSAGSFNCTLNITQGSLSISVTVTDVAGNATSTDITASLQPPTLTITSPEPLALFNTKSITVTGTIDDPQATVTVNDVQATRNGGTFTAEGVILREGSSVVTASATNGGGAVGTASVNVILDTTPPIVTIDSPSNGAVLTAPQISVTGMVNDVVPGTVNTAQMTVTVNGVQAKVANRSFMADGILLVPGKNVITAVATDRAGNTSQNQTTVTLLDIGTQQRILMVSGNNQAGPVGSKLPQPLVVQVVNATGQAIPNIQLSFTVTKSDGQLTSFPQTGRQITLTSDANGEASAIFQLGTRVGTGNNQVQVSSPGFAGTVTFSEISTIGAASQIHDIAGESQTGIIGQPLAEPFVVVVFDDGGNPVAGMPVVFNVDQGTGTLEGNPTATKTTDSDGRASVTLTLGQDVGINNNVVSASFQGLAGSPATFAASGVTPGNPASTTVTGIVLDNANAPLENVTASIEGSNVKALTNSSGRFTITNAPVGSHTLFIDGSTSTEGEPYPFLEFPIVIIAGQDNHLSSPIFLPELDTDNSKVVGGDEDVTLTMKGVPGVSFTVFAHSATFPDGSKVGRMSVSQVHADKVPMPPPNATAPQLFWTVQPPRVKFDPPMRITIPNTGGLAPGTVTEVFCYNHDLEEFASGGTARVSDDGSVIVSDPGSGVIVSGWGAAPPPPPPPTCASKCNCGTCIKGVCVPLIGVSAGNACDDNDACTVHDRCTIFAACKGDKIKLNSLTIKVDGKTDPFIGTLARVINRPINFTVDVDSSNCDGITYDWDFGDGSHSSDQSPTHTYTTTGDYHPSVKAKCKTCSDKQADIRLFVVNVTIAKPTGDPATAGSDDNQFTYSGTLFGSTNVIVQAKVDPDVAEPTVRNWIHWSLSAVPTGSSLSWFAPCPDNDQTGCGTFDEALFFGYPDTNDQFGRKTITMKVIDDDSNTLITATNDIELFFARDDNAFSHGVPNWFFYWNQTGAGNPNAGFADTNGNFGTTPAMLNWSTYGGPRSTVLIDKAVLGSDTRRDGSGQVVSGIDLFANTVRHEMRHVQQIADSNTVNFYTGKTGVLRNAASAGWSFNTGCHAGLWNHFVDLDNSGTFTQGDTDLDQNCDDLPDTMEPSPADVANCVIIGGFQAIECQAERAETVPEDTFKAVDWSNPGKQHH